MSVAVPPETCQTKGRHYPVIALELDAADLAATRFAISPLHEVIGSFFPVYACPGSPQSSWVLGVRRRADVDHDLLAGLLSPGGCIPDFVSPAPVRPRPSFAEQVDQVRQTTPEAVDHDLRAAYAGAPLPAVIKRFEDDPAALRDSVASALEQYWAVALAPRWQRMSAVLESDVLHRGMQCAQLGLGATLNQIDPHIRWEHGALVVDMCDLAKKYVPASGRVTQLIPSVFVQTPLVPISMETPPVISYRSRRSALMWKDATPAASASLRGLLGKRRASLLVALDQPRSTTELARHMNVTPSAVSQHLGLLAASGLVDRVRAGHVVLYSRTELGRQLLTEPERRGDDI
jgi:DNA-binding transcriptional ArsR family regulator